MAEKSTVKQKNGKGDKRGLHPNSLKNLENGRKKWAKGKSGNPNGRPRKELSLTNCAREKLQEKCPYDPGKTWLEYLVDRWLGQAVESPQYFNQLIERLEGKVTQPISGEPGKPIEITVIEKVKDYGNGPS